MPQPPPTQQRALDRLMNPYLNTLSPYPFEKLKMLLADSSPPSHLSLIRLSIGEPQHPSPSLVLNALNTHLQELAHYPTSSGIEALRQTIAQWLCQRYGLPSLNPNTQVLPVSGSREALFAIAQCVVDHTRIQPLVLCPNPFYQIYEGATLLAGAKPYFFHRLAENNFAVDFASIPEHIWKNIQLIYLCSPDNPTGHVTSLKNWEQLFAYADRYGFVIASDECYSEIYADTPPLGALQAAQQLGRTDYRKLLVFSSLSKRSNVPGLRSGFVAGDAQLIKSFLLYRTYHGCAMSLPTQAASIAAWQDETHVIENRRLYQEKFKSVAEILRPAIDISIPDAGFYLWMPTPIADDKFTHQLHARHNVIVLPGRYLARTQEGLNPGENYVRIALVASVEDCVDAAHRIKNFYQTL
jgi:N-succinyldiaminopimelate aminotransferase